VKNATTNRCISTPTGPRKRYSENYKKPALSGRQLPFSPVKTTPKKPFDTHYAKSEFCCSFPGSCYTESNVATLSSAAYHPRKTHRQKPRRDLAGRVPAQRQTTPEQKFNNL
jgi:hypothetical protein